MDTKENLGEVGASWQEIVERAVLAISVDHCPVESIGAGTFDELEQSALNIGHAVSQSLLKAWLSRQAEHIEDSATACPACGRPFESKTCRPRSMSTRAGAVTWNEPIENCRHCRRSFSPSVAPSGA